jgi:hypothetical protein
VRTHWARALTIAYPVLTVYVVIATGNHFFLDAVGGAVIFLVGYGAARVITRAGRGRPLSERDDVVDVSAREVDQPYRSIAVR